MVIFLLIYFLISIILIWKAFDNWAAMESTQKLSKMCRLIVLLLMSFVAPVLFISGFFTNEKEE